MPWYRPSGPGAGSATERDVAWRQAAETLHALGTAEALRRLDRRPGHARARAYLRDTRWDVPGAAPVPLLGQPGLIEAVRVPPSACSTSQSTRIVYSPNSNVCNVVRRLRPMSL